MGSNKPITALLELKKVQEQAKKGLGDKYGEALTPFIMLLQAQMKNPETPDVFSAMKSLKEESMFYKQEYSPMMFAAAVVEIIEVTHFKNFK